jgi:hypothetical protein
MLTYRKSLDGKRKRSKSKCKKYLQKKIAINMNEYKTGRYKTRSQAIAVSYKQVGKKHPACKRILRKRSDGKNPPPGGSPRSPKRPPGGSPSRRRRYLKY